MKLGRFYILKPTERRNDKDTGAFSYSSCTKKINNYVHAGKNLDIIFIKITNQKKIKNQLGIDAFYLLLRSISEKLYEIIGTEKTELFYLEVGAYAVVSLKNDSEDIRQKAEKINEFFLQKQVINNLEVIPEYKICVANYPENLNSIDSIVNFGNSFHHIISASNKVIYLSDEVLSNEFKIKSNIDLIIKKGITNNSFKMFYQPIYDIEKRKFTMAEALIRLDDEVYGKIPASTIIAAAERSGAIHDIGKNVFEAVCLFISETPLEELGLETISINLSVSQCIENDLNEKLLEIMNKYDITTDKIALEVTESSANFNPEISDKNFKQLTKLGINISLDNYGTGYSNLKRIISLPFSVIKLDKSFAYMHNDPKMGVIVNKMLDNFKRLNKKVLIEGVEDAETLNYFVDAGCDYTQGFYYTKALSQQDLIEFLKENNR